MTTTPDHDDTRRDDDTRRRTRTALVLVLLLALGTAAIGTLQRSTATTVAVAETTGNSIEVVAIRLFTDAVAAPFDVTDLAPGDSVTRCVEVTHEGWTTESGPVRLYLDGYRDPAGLDDHLLLDVVLGPDGSRCGDDLDGDQVAGGTLSGLAATLVDHTTGAGDWVPADDTDTRAWWITVTLDIDAPPSMMGARVDQLTLVWEAVS